VCFPINIVRASYTQMTLLPAGPIVGLRPNPIYHFPNISLALSGETVALLFP
jgi:hypothetical protein